MPHYGDVFFDSVDIHSRAKKINDYDPVSFVFDINVLNKYDVRITKDNPKYWSHNMLESKRYFTSREEIIEHFTKGNFKQEIIIHNPKIAVGFEFLKEIVLDNPHIENTTYFVKAKEALKSAMEINKIDVPLTIRECPPDCMCIKKYKNAKEGYTYYRFKTHI